VPVLAPYFHMAFGWGISVAFLVWEKVGKTDSPLIIPFVTLLGPAFGMAWDPALRILELISGGGQGARPAAAATIMVGSVVWTCFIKGDGLVKQKKGGKKDWVLFAICLANSGFFSSMCFFSTVHNANLKLVIFSIAVMCVGIFGRGCGVMFQ